MGYSSRGKSSSGQAARSGGVGGYTSRGAGSARALSSRGGGFVGEAVEPPPPDESEGFTFFMQMKTPTPPSGLVCARTGAQAFVARSLSTGVFVAADTPLFEDRGGDEGGGYWTHPGYTNDMAGLAVDFSAAAGWTYSGAPAPVFTANDALGPDGTDLADKLRDGNASAICAIGKTGLVATVAMYSLWVQDVAGDAPTLPGSFTQDGSAVVGVAFPVGTAWRRVSFRGTAGSAAFYVWPAGVQPGAVVHTHTGAVRVWGASRTRVVSVADIPFVDGTSGDCILTLDATARAAIVQGGDIDLEFAVIPQVPLISSFGSGTAHYLFHEIHPEGEFSLRYDLTNTRWILKRRGVDFILTDAFETTRGGTTNVHFREGDEVTCRIWDLPSQVGALGTRSCGIRLSVNGACGLDKRGTSSGGGAYAPPTAVTLGSNGTPTANMAMRWTKFGVKTSHADLATDAPVQGVILGDSTTATRTADQIASAVAMRTVSQARARAPIGVLSCSGDTAAGQLTKWDAATNTWRGMASVQWAIIGVGINEIAGNVLTVAQILANIQALADRLKVTNAGIKTAVRLMCPSKTYLDGINVNLHPNWWVPINDALNGVATAANGFTIIIGVDARISSHLAVLDPSSTGNMIASMQVGDFLHPSNLGRAAISAADVAALVSLGFTP